MKVPSPITCQFTARPQLVKKINNIRLYASENLEGRKTDKEREEMTELRELIGLKTMPVDQVELEKHTKSGGTLTAWLVIICREEKGHARK